MFKIGLNLEEMATPLPSECLEYVDKPYSLCSFKYKSDAANTGTFPANNCATTEFVPRLSLEYAK